MIEQHLAIEQRPVNLPPAIVDALRQARRNAPAQKTPVIVVGAGTEVIAVMGLTDLMVLLETLPRSLALPLAHPRWHLDMTEVDADWGSTAGDREWLEITQPDRLEW